MHLRPAALIFPAVATAAITAACSSGHSLFAGSQATGSGGGSSQGTGASPGSGGAGATGGSTTGSGAMPGASSSSSGATTTSSSSSSSTGGGTYPAAFPAPPQVVTFGGAVLASPKIYPVFFSNDDAASVATLTDFTQHVGGTPYWTATTSEYGVGPATGEAAIKLTEAAPATIDDAAIQSWLATKFAGNFGFPAPDANTLIVIYYPAGTTVTLQGASSCSSFGGYHQGAAVGNNVTIAYAVVPRCASLDNLTGLASTTGAASHELIEAATDPRPQTMPARAEVDEADIYWELLLGGGEVGDMCAQFPGVFTTFAPSTYTVQRTWSNKSALAGHDPCVPQPAGEVYFNAAPVLPDLAPLNTGNGTAMVKAVKIPVGGTGVVSVELFSDGPIGAWTVGAVDPAPKLGSPQLLDLTLNQTTGKNGDVLQLTIKVLQAGNGNLEAFYITSTSGNREAIWFGAVAN